MSAFVCLVPLPFDLVIIGTFPSFFPFLLQISYMTLYLVWTIRHCHPFSKKGQTFKRVLMFSSTFCFSLPSVPFCLHLLLEEVTHFLQMSCILRFRASDKIETQKTERLYALACGLYPLPRQNRKRIGSSWRFHHFPCNAGLFASEAYTQHTLPVFNTLTPQG